MPRVSYSQSLKNRARIVKVASELFRTHGIEAVSISDVMKAAGMTQGGFYTHFESKDHLVAEAWALSFAGSVESWKNIAAGSTSAGRNALAELVRYYIAPKAPEMTCPIVSFALNAGERDPDHPMREAYAKGVKSLFDAFSEVAGSNRDGSFRDEMSLLFAAMVGTNLLSQGIDQASWLSALKKAVRKAAESH